MSKVINFLSGIKILEETSSSQNGKITVVKSLAFGKYIQVGGLTQSGGIIKSIWTTSLRKVHKKHKTYKNSLVLGLGGGSIVDVLSKLWSDIKVIGVDIDPVMVELGNKYLELSDRLKDIKISDAFEFTKIAANQKKKFDLVCVDLYVGDEFPLKFESEAFLRNIKRILSSGGVVVFNRLYYGKKRSQSVKFGVFLEKFFKKVEVVYPEANIMFICSS